MSSTPTVTVPSICTAPSISTASKFVVPSTSIAPEISKETAATSAGKVKFPELSPIIQLTVEESLLPAIFNC